MNRNAECEIFLEYLRDLYLQNPDLPILKDTIYVELVRFITTNGKKGSTSFDSLVGVQVQLNNKFRNNNKVNTYSSSNGDFWAIENRMGKNDDDFLAAMYNGIKLYIPVQADNLYKISESLFNFMINEGIIMQCKVSKEMRNDALVCRVKTKEDAIKVSEYLSSIGYTSNVKPNPFLYDNGTLSMTIDGVLSFNSMVASVLKEYLYTRKMTHTLDSVSCKNFNNFVKSQIEFLNSNQKKAFMDLYQINGEEQYRDFITILKLLSENLSATLTTDKLFEYQDTDYVRLGSSKGVYFKQDEAKILYVINVLTSYYSVDYVHKMIMEFIKTNNYDLFTRKYGDYGGVRTIIRNNFSSTDVKNIISDLGWKAFISASKVTYDKYGEDQLFAAIKNVFNGEGISEFTNDHEVRSYLGLIIPYELLKEVIVSKMHENDMSISTISLANLMLEEINKIEDRKVNGRK